MIFWNPRLAAHVAEQRFAFRIPPAHRTSPTSRHATRIVTQYLAQLPDFFRSLLRLLRVARKFDKSAWPTLFICIQMDCSASNRTHALHEKCCGEPPSGNFV